ncbi:unnamed protein product [Acanthoscelides obtectus]|uniref:Uncharacterized protein n=1 Tax=Acanthoscelides obtectus TaxID=200917 RepID=A0A9P0LPN5_ACAOB|nr:unnamed protein product [Acanthoscelides obtectus]CAK1654810.1 hypothetical protein AOBTE_LOCUS18862 [Acanthoscelides obtectus]
MRQVTLGRLFSTPWPVCVRSSFPIHSKVCIIINKLLQNKTDAVRRVH